MVKLKGIKQLATQEVVELGFEPSPPYSKAI